MIVSWDPRFPLFVEELYDYFATEIAFYGYPPQERAVPYGLWAFYQGLRIGAQFDRACRETEHAPPAPH